MSKKQTVYIESTIPSYLVARPSRDLLKLTRQMATQQWWSDTLPNLHPFISNYVIEEIRLGDIDAAKKRENAIRHIEVLETNEEVISLADTFIKRLNIPKKAHTDAFHLAIAVIYKIDYLVSWNFDHIVGPPVRKTFAEIGRELNCVMPVLCTPSDFSEVEL